MNSALELHPKVAGGSLSGAVGLIVLWVLSLWHVSVTPEESGALVLVLGSVGAYFAPLLKKEQASWNVAPAVALSGSYPYVATSGTLSVTSVPPLPKVAPVAKTAPVKKAS